MPVFALYNLNDTTTTAIDSAVGNGAQNGTYFNGASSSGGRAILDGVDDIVKIINDPAFQLPRGTLEIQFSLEEGVTLTEPRTILSRDSNGETAGGYRIESMPDGSVRISHESPTGTEVFQTGPGFQNPGDEINVSYSWDATSTGGFVQINNLTTGTEFNDTVPNTLTMDMGGINQNWVIGASQDTSPPGTLQYIDENYQGSVEYFSISDTVDNPPGDQDPDANPDVAETDEDTPVNIPVLANDSDPEGEPLVVTSCSAPRGTVTINPDGTITYLPNPNFNGTDTITYTVEDPAGNSSTSTVTVTVNPVNDAPDAVNDAFSTPLNTPITVGVLGNDTDPDGDLLNVTSITQPANGTAALASDGTITFTPDAGFTGTTTLTYTITDFNGGTDTATVTFTVTGGTGPQPDGIVEGTTGGDLIDTAYTGDPNGDFIDNNDALLPGEAPQDDIVRAYGGNDTVFANLGNDDVTAAAGNDLVYGGAGDDFVTGDTGNDELHGDDGNDSLGGGQDNDTLFGGAGNDSLNGGLGTDVLDGGTGNDTLIATEGENVLIGGDGNDSAVGGSGPDFIDTRSTDSSPDRTYPGLYTADANPADDLDTVTAGTGNDTIFTGDDRDVIVSGAGNDSVDAGDDDDSVQGNDGDDIIVAGEGNDTVTGDLGNDLIHGGTPSDATDPTHLVDAVDLDPNNNRDLLAGGVGSDTIYGGDDDDTLSGGLDNDFLDGGIDEDLITGETGNDTIIGGQGADTMTGGADRDVFVGATAGDVVDGSGTGDDFDTLDLLGVGPVRVTYDPADAENGTVAFLDADGNTTGTMTFVEIENVILPSGEAPTANPDTATTPQFTDITIPVLANDTDPEGEPLTVTSATAENGDVTINPDGTITYSPNRDYNGPDDTITYTITDPDGNTSTSTVTVTITNLNDLPTAEDDFASTPLNTPVVIDVLLNDTDPDGDTLTVVGTPTTADGTVTVNPDGSITFVPATGFTGSAIINYTVSDGNGGTDPAIVVVQVGMPDDRDGIVRGTTGNDMIDATYVDPTDGDVVDGTDAIIPGDAPNDDRIVAGDGNDTILAGVADDTIYAGTGDDQVYGGDGFETIFGEAGDDTIFGGNGQELVEGGAGDDYIDTRGPNPLPDIDYPGLYAADTDPTNDLDTVYGGDGNDTVFTGDDADRVFGRDGADYLDGGFDDDSLYGGAQDDTIIGSEGNDSIDGGRGDDLIYGGLDLSFPDVINIPDNAGDLRPGNNGDFIEGGFGNDTIYGQDDADTIRGDEGNDVVFGGVDNDSVSGGAGNDILAGDDGDDTLEGNGDDDILSGGRGDDLIDGGLGNDVIAAGEGDDTVTGSDGVDIIGGGAGNDSIDGGFDTDLIIGEAGDDTIQGNAGSDLLSGGDGDDLVEGGLSDDFMLGDAGEDTLIGGANTDVIEGGTEDDLIYGDGTVDGGNTPDGAADFLLGEAGDDTIFGGSGADLIIGGEGADSLSGGDDEDTFLEVGPGDVVDGGEGTEFGTDFDTLEIVGPALVEYDPANSENGTIFHLDLATQTIIGTSTFTNIENIVFVNEDPETESGEPELGEDDPDVVAVPAPPVIITVGTQDGIVNGTGAGEVIDINYTGDPEGDRIDNSDAILPGEAPQDDIVEAGGGADTIYSGLGNDDILAGDGDDRAFGGDGSDDIRGEAGNDYLEGNAGDDGLDGGTGDDTLNAGIGNDTLDGQDGDDSMIGGAGNDFLNGEAGDDTMFGGTGNDALIGGDGNDLLNAGDEDFPGDDGNPDLVYGGNDADRIVGTGVGDTVFGGAGGVDEDTLVLDAALGPRRVTTTVDSDGNGFDGTVEYLDADGNVTGTTTFTNIETIVCFTPGTLIATPKGEVPVEQLRVGDKVITRDNGIQEIRWMGAKEMGWHDFAGNPHLRPVMVKAGSLGNGLPERDMMLSPNHRLLVANDRTALYFDEHEVLVAAKHLIGGQGVHQVESVGTTYFHFMFDQHEVVLSNGAWTESFQPGDYTLKGLGNAQRNELFELFPELKAPAGIEAYQAARKTLKKHEARLLVR